MSMRRLVVVLLGLGSSVALLGPWGEARACSVCRCGDPTFNALGTDVYGASPWRLAFDWDRFDKTQATQPEDSGAGAGREALVEQRVTAVLSYVFAERIAAVARVPYSFRRLKETPDRSAPVEEETSTHGFSDPEIYGLVRLWATPFAPGLGRRAWASGLLGVKPPWGRNKLAEAGQRLDEHVQSGTGSTDLFAGVSGVYLFNSEATGLASVQFRRMGTNDFGYRYGDLLLANLGLEHKLGARFDGVLELNFRSAPEDRIDASGAHDPDTGGDVLYLTPRLISSLGNGLVARATLQIPVAKRLDGEQTERTVVNLGLTYLRR
jgi:hypothetical protein